VIGICQWINIWKRIDMFVFVSITFEIFENTHFISNNRFISLE
jgi:hypothetical protein